MLLAVLILASSASAASLAKRSTDAVDLWSANAAEVELGLGDPLEALLLCTLDEADRAAVAASAAAPDALFAAVYEDRCAFYHEGEPAEVEAEAGPSGLELGPLLPFLAALADCDLPEPRLQQLMDSGDLADIFAQELYAEQCLF